MPFFIITPTLALRVTACRFLQGMGHSVRPSLRNQRGVQKHTPKLVRGCAITAAFGRGGRAIPASHTNIPCTPGILYIFPMGNIYDGGGAHANNFGTAPVHAGFQWLGSVELHLNTVLVSGRGNTVYGAAASTARTTSIACPTFVGWHGSTAEPICMVLQFCFYE